MAELEQQNEEYQDKVAELQDEVDDLKIAMQEQIVGKLTVLESERDDAYSKLETTQKKLGEELSAKQ